MVSRSTARRRAPLPAALTAAALVLGACGSDGGSLSGRPAVNDTVPAAPTDGGKGAGKLSAALRQQVANAGGRAQDLPYSGGAPTRADGRIEVAFHGVGVIGAAEQDALRGLGAEIVQTLPADPRVPAAGVIVVWIPPDKVVVAAAADWVAAVTPPAAAVPR